LATALSYRPHRRLDHFRPLAAANWCWHCNQFT
jgi:hypothetical protein